MSAVALLLLLLPVAAIVGAIVYLLNRLLYGGIFGAFSWDDDTQIVITGNEDNEDAPHYKIKQHDDEPGNFMFIPEDSYEDSEPGAPDATPGAPDATPGVPDPTPGAPDATPGAPDATPRGPEGRYRTRTRTRDMKEVLINTLPINT